MTRSYVPLTPGVAKSLAMVAVNEGTLNAHNSHTYYIHSKRFWTATADGRPMFRQQIDINLPMQPLVH